MLTVKEWEKYNLDYDTYHYFNANGEEESFFINSEEKYNAHVLRVKVISSECGEVAIYTDYVEKKN